MNRRWTYRGIPLDEEKDSEQIAAGQTFRVVEDPVDGVNQILRQVSVFFDFFLGRTVQLKFKSNDPVGTRCMKRLIFKTLMTTAETCVSLLRLITEAGVVMTELFAQTAVLKTASKSKPCEKEILERLEHRDKWRFQYQAN
jgi:hypothetical protein